MKDTDLGHDILTWDSQDQDYRKNSTFLGHESVFRLDIRFYVKGTPSPKHLFSYMQDITLLNIIHKLNISFLPLFGSKIGDLVENVSLEGQEKQAIVSCSGLEKQRSLL